MLKSILLGGAAALVLIGGASAADLGVAEPIDYVKVCDAFGKGYFYSPGTDTCIKVGGYVKFKAQASGGGANDTDYDTVFGQFYTETSLQLTASSVTEYGALTGYYELRARAGSGYVRPVGVDTNVYIKQGYIKLAGLQAGHFTSLFDFGRGYTDTGSFGSDVETDHIAYTYALGPFALSASIEDPSDRLKVAPDAQPDAPDLVAAIGYASGPITAKIAGAYVQTADFADDDSGYAVGGSFEVLLDSMGKGDKFTLQGAYADNAPSYTGLAGNTSLLGTSNVATATPGWSYSALASYKHVWNAQWNSSITGGYLNSEYIPDGTGGLYKDGSSAFRGVINTVFTPVKGLDILGEGLYTKSDDFGDDGYRWQANLFLKRTW